MGIEATAYFSDSVARTSELCDSSRRQRDVLGPVDSVANLQVRSCEAVTQIPENSDEVLLAQVSFGSRDALAILFRHYARLVRAVAYRILRNEAEADDLVQEVFLFIFQKAKLFDAARGNARSWIVQVTYHRAIDRRRYLASRHFYNGEALNDRMLCNAPVVHYEESIEGSLGRATLREIKEALSEDQHQVLELYFYDGFALGEIAEAMGQTVGNIRNHYYRGLEKMRRHIFEAKSRAR